uniref:Beta/alpha-defensin C-terminal domain-containing protein n=1 Tax=Pelusios castaneus TaxID=367368 RepID=A0A8C8RQ92_9SAUR
MNILPLLFPVYFLLPLLASPGDGYLLKLIDSFTCKRKHGMCREDFCYLNEKQIGTCPLSRWYCCRRKK